jgi:hypothetical protein
MCGIITRNRHEYKTGHKPKLRSDISVRYAILSIGYMAVFAILFGATIGVGVPAAVVPIPVRVLVMPSLALSLDYD